MSDRPLDSFPVLHTERLILRLPTKEDAQDLWFIKRDAPDAGDYGDAYWKGIEDGERFVVNFEKRWTKDVGIGWGFALQSSPERLIGTSQLHTPDEGALSIQIDYELHVDQWGKGYATEALRAILAYGMSNRFSFHLNRIWALTGPSNEPSIRLLNRLGFRYEGTLRESAFYGGRFWDQASYSLLRSDFSEASSPSVPQESP